MEYESGLNRDTTNKIAHSQLNVNCSVDVNLGNDKFIVENEFIKSISTYCTLRPKDVNFWRIFGELYKMENQLFLPKEKCNINVNKNSSEWHSDSDETYDEDFHRYQILEKDEDVEEDSTNSFKYCTLKKPDKKPTENVVGDLSKYCTIKLSNDQILSLSKSEEYKSLCCMIENQKLEKCLSDLDNFLEKNTSDNESESCIEMPNEEDQELEVPEASKAPEIDSFKRNKFSTLSKRFKNLKDKNFLRSTFQTASLNDRRLREVNQEYNLSGENRTDLNSEDNVPTAGCSRKLSRRHPSWIRNSMRYSTPVVLPEIENSNIPSVSYRRNSLRDTNSNNFNSSSEEKTTGSLKIPEHVETISETCDTENASSPRQNGRRSNPFPRIVSITSEIDDRGEIRIVTHQRTSASNPDTPRAVMGSRNRMHSEPSSLGSSRNPSPVSIASSTASSSIASTRGEINTSPTVTSSSAVITAPQRSRGSLNTESRSNSNNTSQRTSGKKTWPHLMSRSLCTLCCTVGLFNISRFSVLSVIYGGNFLIQFLILSTVFGIPFMWFQICLGAKIKGGIVTMFKISPICKGIGISIMITQCVIALYSNISIIWVFVYLKDSIFLKNSGVQYNWQENFRMFNDFNSSNWNILKENYFNINVLKRFPSKGMGTVKFQLVMFLLILWSSVFLILFKGIKSFGKAIFPIVILAFIGLLSVCCKFSVVTNVRSVQELFPPTEWQDFFVNSNSWISAAQETFLTWGLLGCSIYLIYCKPGPEPENKAILRREAFFVAFFSLLILFISAMFSNSCVNILKSKQIAYKPRMYPARYLTVLGDEFHTNLESPQVLRLVTEIMPMTLTVSRVQIHPIWGFIGFLSLILFGIAQACSLWFPIASAVGSTPSAILLSCICGLFLGIPLVTDNGIILIRYLDFIFGGAWWFLIIWMLYLVTIFMIRGRPFTSDVVVKDLKLNETLSAFIAFSWNVLLPVGLVLLSIMKYKISHSDELYHNRLKMVTHLKEWYNWARLLGGYLQLGVLILIPVVSIIQIYRYLSKGPPDILERFQLLYRPPLDSSNNVQTSVNNRQMNQRPPVNQRPVRPPVVQPTYNDDPPKYTTLTPPPSYNAATGLRIVKMLRNSIRRSVRRMRQNNTESDPQQPNNSDPQSSRNVLRSLQRNVGNALGNVRSSLRRNRNTVSVDNLVFSEVPPSNTSMPNQSNLNENSSVV